MPGQLLRALAVDPTSKGFCFALLEGSERLVDWGCRQVPPADPERFVLRLSELLERFQPDFLVLEEPDGSRRRGRGRERIAAATALAGKRGLPVATVSRKRITETFAGAGDKHGIAESLSRYFPELLGSLPKKRKPWASEDERMNVFDALSFALVILWERQARERQSADQ